MATEVRATHIEISLLDQVTMTKVFTQLRMTLTKRRAGQWGLVERLINESNILADGDVRDPA
jgi:hypothetical protein